MGDTMCDICCNNETAVFYEKTKSPPTSFSHFILLRYSCNISARGVNLNYLFKSSYSKVSRKWNNISIMKKRGTIYEKLYGI